MSNPFDDLLAVRPPDAEQPAVQPDAPVMVPPDQPAPEAAPAPELPAEEPERITVPDPTHTEPGDPVPENPGPVHVPEPAAPTEVSPVETESLADPPPVLGDHPEAQAAEAAKQPASPSRGPRTADDRPDRSASLKLRHRAALDAVFGVEGVAYEVVQEVHLPEDQRFKTPFGNSGRHGWVIREKNTGQMHTIGASALKIGINEYKVIDPIPAKRRGRKPREDAPESTVEVPAEA